MTADMLTGDDSLASQCLAFCQTLASQGMDFHFSLTTTPPSLSPWTPEEDQREFYSDKEEVKPFYAEEECQEERRVPEKEAQL